MPLRRPTTPRTPLALALAVLLAAPLACGGDAQEAEGETTPYVKPGETQVAPEEGAGAAPPAAAPAAPGAETAAPASGVEAARAEVERLEARVDEAEQELEAARADLAQARDALARAKEAGRAPARSDAEIFRAVQRRLLEDPALSRVAIRAEVEDGVVTLHGRVPDRDTARTAGTLAAGVAGVVRVESEVQVGGS